MKSATLCFLCLMGFTRGAQLRAASRTTSPVEKIVSLLKDLKSQLETDAKEEEKSYNKYACWCEKTSKRKAADIVEGTDSMRLLSQQILTLKGKVATLDSELAELKHELEVNGEQQDSETNLRQKQNGEFMAASEEMKDALAAMEQAVKVLVQGTAAAGAGAMIQEGTQVRMRMAVQNVLEKIPSQVREPVERLSLLDTFTRADLNYAPQSGTIQGILTDMYTTFSADLEAATRTEAIQNKNYESLMFDLKTTQAELEDDKAHKEEQKADAESSLAEATSTYDDTKKDKEADIEFFDATKKACTEKSSEWNLRESLRSEELEGVEKTLEILTADGARDLFAKAIKPGDETKVDESIPAVFLQVSGRNSQASEMARKAYDILKAQATKGHSFKIAMIAVNLRNAKVGHFDGVIKAIDDMIKVLEEEGAADIAKRDECKDQYQDVSMKTSDLTWKISVNDATIEKLQAKQRKADAEKTATIEEIQATRADLAALLKTRNAENDAFKTAKSEDEQVVALLTAAKNTLAAYYKKNDIKLGPIQGAVSGLSFRQGQEPVFDVSEDQAPDATLSGKGSHKQESKGIISLLSRLIEDAQDEIRNGISNEDAAQAAYDEQKAAGDNLIKDLTEKEVNLEGVIAKAEEDETAEEASKSNNKGDLDQVEKHMASIKPDCDWIIGAFEKRAEGRAAEMSGLVTAKEFLAGKH